MNTLVLDQSTSCTGWALFDESGSLIEYGHFTPKGRDSAVDRMMQTIDFLNNFHLQYSTIVYEEIQLQAGNAATFQLLAQLQGMILLFAKKTERGYASYYSTAWKSSCGIKGRKRVEQKANAHLFCENKFGVSPKEVQDACDALCLGYHHFIMQNKVK